VWGEKGLSVRPFSHSDLETWRSNFKGLRVAHAATGATIYGAIDDLWQHRDGQAGPHTHWMGVFRTEKALLAAFRKQGLILLSEVGSISDADILLLWRPA
jgi:hypothetical protein